MSTLKVINLQHPSSSNTVTLDANSNLTIAGTAINPFQGMKNRIINGDMRIDQRNGGSSVSTTANITVYTVDRFSVLATQSSKFSAQQNAGSVTPPAGFSNYLGITSLSTYTSVSTDLFRIFHVIEGYNIVDLAWGTSSAKPITMSFWVRSSLTGTFGGCLQNSSNNRAYAFTYTITSANTWEFKTITIPGETSGTWGSVNAGGIHINFDLGSGSTKQISPGSWQAVDANAATGCTSVLGTNGATLYITGFQLEVGSIATAFERRYYGTELALCQRYFQITDSFWGVATSSTTIMGTLPFVVPMRGNPSITTLVKGSATTLAITDFILADYSQSSANISIVNNNRVSTTGLCFTAANFSGLTARYYYGSKPNNVGVETAFIALTSEL